MRLRGIVVVLVVLLGLTACGDDKTDRVTDLPTRVPTASGSAPPDCENTGEMVICDGTVVSQTPTPEYEP